MMASTSSARSKPGLSLIEDEYWYAGPLSERKAEVVLTKLGEPGSFLVRDSLLPEADYVLSVNSGKDIWHYDVKVLPTNECIFNKYTFTSLPDAVTFYMENRLGPVFLKEPMEPVVSEAQLKSFGPNLIKIATSESVKPPRTSPFVTADNSTTSSTQSHGITTSESQQPTSCASSLQTRRLTAPESLQSPHTPPIILPSSHTHHTSSSQSRRLPSPESLKLPHSSLPASTCNQQASHSHISNSGPQESFKTPHEVLVDSHTQSTVCPLRQPVYDRVIMSDAVVHHAALPKSSALAAGAGDGWTDSLSGTGSQVSIGSHSPKPHSVSHFAIDLEDGAGTSQSQSQTSEVDCTYIGPSNAEPVFVTSGYMYIKPPSSNFSPNEKNDIKDQLLKEKHSPKDEKLNQEADKGEACETVSSVSASTAILNVSSITESTPVSEDTCNLQHATNEGSTLQSTKTSPEGIIICATTSSEQLDKMPSVADRRLAFEKQFQVRESDMKVAPKPGRKPPVIPKRVSSISNVVKQQDSTNGDNDITSSVEEPSSSLGIENTITEEEEEPPPPPPLTTHPCVLMKSESEEQLEVRDDSTTTKSAAKLLQEGGAHRPKPKERRISVPAVKSEPDQNSRSVTLRDDTSTHASEVTKPIAEVEVIPVSVFPEEDKGPLDIVHVPAPPPQKEANLNGRKTSDDSEAGDGKQGVNAETFEEETDYLYDEQYPSTSTFGHTGTSTLLDVNEISEESTKLRSGLDGIDLNKSMGAEVSTFKPVPKPRSFQRHSMYVGDTTPAITESSGDLTSPTHQPTDTDSPTVAASPLRLPKQPYSYTPDMKRSSMHFPTPENKRKMIFRAQSMSMTSTTGSASPRMLVRGEQRSQMPPGFVMYSRSQEAVVGRHPTVASNTLLRSLQASTGKKGGDGDKKVAAAAAPMNTKRANLKKRRSFFKRK